jgi:hypothetical protein
MVRLRAEKVARIADRFKPIRLDSGPTEGELLILGWGSTYGAIRTAALQLQAEGMSVAHVHIRHLFPFNKGLGPLLKKYKKVLVPEMNSGQLRQMLRAEFLVDAQGLNKIQGMPFTSEEIKRRIARSVEAMSTVNGTITTPEKIDFSSDQEVRWCPGCGDYSILKQVQTAAGAERQEEGGCRLHQRDRLLIALPILPGYVWPSQHPRSRSGHREWTAQRAARVERMDDHR